MDAELKKLAIYATLIFMMAPVSLLVYFFVYNKRKKKHQEEKLQLQAEFNRELLKTQNEIQEQTLTYVSREIHDNITQVLSFVKLNLAMAGNLTAADQTVKIDESRKLLAQTIADLRDLSKSMSFEHITQLGLVKTIGIEVERISRSGLLQTELDILGDVYTLGSQRELVLFRIFQEALNNTFKHSCAKHLKISLQYSEQIFTLTIADDGNGFLAGPLQNEGSGLKNIVNRASLIGASADIESAPGKGCCVKITIDPLLQQAYADGTYPNSPGG